MQKPILPFPSNNKQVFHISENLLKSKAKFFHSLSPPLTGFRILLIKSNCREIRCTYTFLQLPSSIKLNPKSFSDLIPLMISRRGGSEKLSLPFFHFFRFFLALSLSDAALRQAKFGTELLKLSTFKA